MSDAIHSIHSLCCGQCWHNKETPCPKYLPCLTDGPLCHEDGKCREKRQAHTARMRRETISRPLILVGTGTCGMGAGSGHTFAAIQQYLATRGIDAEVSTVGCIGLCVAEPIVDIQLPGKNRISFQNVKAEQVTFLLDKVLNGETSGAGVQVLAQHRHPQGEAWDGVKFLDDHPFFKPQKRWVLANCGRIDPSSIDEYLAHGGYRALARVIGHMTPLEACELAERSGVRGRGGGGFPSGKKWKIALGQSASQKYFICNADEGDPGAFMDRAVIEGDPHRVLEGLAIGAYAIGASIAYVYIRAEYPLAIARLKEAIAAAQEYGILGRNIFDSGFNLKVIIKQGAGAFVCGEETALIHSIEGKRGMPRPRPPFPAASGLFGNPTIINNVETLANLPGIFLNGPEWFSSVGTRTSKGTKVFALSGKVQNTGLIEVEMGTTVRDIIFTIGGGIPDGKQFKAVQMGGPSGGCIPEQHLDIEIDYESLKTVGAMMGSGGMVVMDEDTCMVDVAKFFMDFIQRESCGKCISCREGTKQLLSIFNQITRSPRKETDTETLTRMQGVMSLESLSKVIQSSSLCGLGQSAPNPVLSTLRWFLDEYETHIYERHCPAKVCKDLLTYSINQEKCSGCTLCGKKCGSGAIVGSLKMPHHIVMEKCTGCGACYDACRKQAIERE